SDSAKFSFLPVSLSLSAPLFVAFISLWLVYYHRDQIMRWSVWDKAPPFVKKALALILYPSKSLRTLNAYLLRKKIISIFNEFNSGIDLRLEDCDIERIYDGYINLTYCIIVRKTGQKFIIQRLNRIFNIKAIDNNLQLLEVAQEKAKGVLPEYWQKAAYLNLRGTSRSKIYYDRQGKAWRVMNFISGEIFNSFGDISEEDREDAARSLGEAIAIFGRMLDSIDVDLWKKPLPNYHNAGYHKAYLDSIIEGKERTLSLSRDLSHTVKILPQIRKKYSDRIDGLLKDIEDRNSLVTCLDDLDLVVTHADTKINNAVFIRDERGRLRCASLIDLDTLQVGNELDDLGDALRSSGNPAGEEPEDINDVRIDRLVVERIIEGFLAKVEEFNGSQKAKSLRPYALDAFKQYLYIQSIRFFADALVGNKYFKLKSGQPEDWNLYRAEVQMRALKELEKIGHRTPREDLYELTRRGGVVLYDPDGIKAEKVNQHPLPSDSRILVIETKDGQHIPYAKNIATALKDKRLRNNIKTITKAGGPDIYEELMNFRPHMIIAPYAATLLDDQPLERVLEDYVRASSEELGVFYYEHFLERPRENYFHPFSEEEQEKALYALGAHKTQIRRTDFIEVARNFYKYSIESARYFGWDFPEDKVGANPFILARIANGEMQPLRFKHLELPPCDEAYVVSPHPDDTEIAAAGLVRYFLGKGISVHNIVMNLDKWGVVLTEEEKRELLDRYGSEGEERRAELRRPEVFLAAKRSGEGLKKEISVDILNLEISGQNPGKANENINDPQFKEDIEKVRDYVKKIYSDSKSKKVSFVIPFIEDSHPHHRIANKIFLKILKEVSKEKGIEFSVLFYLASWAGDFNVYFNSKNYAYDDLEKFPDNLQLQKEIEIAGLFKKGLSDLVGELTGGFGTKSSTPEELGGDSAERFRYKHYKPDSSLASNASLTGDVTSTDKRYSPLRNMRIKDLSRKIAGHLTSDCHIDDEDMNTLEPMLWDVTPEAIEESYEARAILIHPSQETRVALLDDLERLALTKKEIDEITETLISKNLKTKIFVPGFTEPAEVDISDVVEMYVRYLNPKGRLDKRLVQAVDDRIPKEMRGPIKVKLRAATWDEERVGFVVKLLKHRPVESPQFIEAFDWLISEFRSKGIEKKEVRRFLEDKKALCNKKLDAIEMMENVLDDRSLMPEQKVGQALGPGVAYSREKIDSELSIIEYFLRLFLPEKMALSLGALEGMAGQVVLSKSGRSFELEFSSEPKELVNEKVYHRKITVYDGKGLYERDMLPEEIDGHKELILSEVKATWLPGTCAFFLKDRETGERLKSVYWLGHVDKDGNVWIDFVNFMKSGENGLFSAISLLMSEGLEKVSPDIEVKLYIEEINSLIHLARGFIDSQLDPADEACIEALDTLRRDMPAYEDLRGNQVSIGFGERREEIIEELVKNLHTLLHKYVLSQDVLRGTLWGRILYEKMGLSDIRLIPETHESGIKRLLLIGSRRLKIERILEKKITKKEGLNYLNKIVEESARPVILVIYGDSTSGKTPLAVQLRYGALGIEREDIIVIPGDHRSGIIDFHKELKERILEGLRQNIKLIIYEGVDSILNFEKIKSDLSGCRVVEIKARGVEGRTRVISIDKISDIGTSYNWKKRFMNWIKGLPDRVRLTRALVKCCSPGKKISSYMRRYAAIFLGERGNKKAVDIQLRALKDSSLRRIALENLAIIANRKPGNKTLNKAVKPLLKMLSLQEEHSSVTLAALILGRIAEDNKRFSDKIMKALLRTSPGNNWLAQMSIMEELARLGYRRDDARPGLSLNASKEILLAIKDSVNQINSSLGKGAISEILIDKGSLLANKMAIRGSYSNLKSLILVYDGIPEDGLAEIKQILRQKLEGSAISFSFLDEAAWYTKEKFEPMSFFLSSVVPIYRDGELIEIDVVKDEGEGHKTRRKLFELWDREGLSIKEKEILKRINWALAVEGIFGVYADLPITEEERETINLLEQKGLIELNDQGTQLTIEWFSEDLEYLGIKLVDKERKILKRKAFLRSVWAKAPPISLKNREEVTGEVLRQVKSGRKVLLECNYEDAKLIYYYILRNVENPTAVSKKIYFQPDGSLKELHPRINKGIFQRQTFRFSKLAFRKVVTIEGEKYYIEQASISDESDVERLLEINNDERCWEKSCQATEDVMRSRLKNNPFGNLLVRDEKGRIISSIFTVQNNLTDEEIENLIKEKKITWDSLTGKGSLDGAHDLKGKRAFAYEVSTDPEYWSSGIGGHIISALGEYLPTLGVRKLNTATTLNHYTQIIIEVAFKRDHKDSVEQHMRRRHKIKKIFRWLVRKKTDEFKFTEEDAKIAFEAYLDKWINRYEKSCQKKDYIDIADFMQVSAGDIADFYGKDPKKVKPSAIEEYAVSEISRKGKIVPLDVTIGFHQREDEIKPGARLRWFVPGGR
ncbi:MAG: phosphotransferase, partial [Candidatus Omnitrophica bacterium]|nr:phosphotransferase [Candidatus Omnitrophota bacterium]